MEKFNPVALIEIQDILSSKNIVRLKKDFLKRKNNPEDIPIDADEENGILYHYDSYKNDIVITKFENELKEILWHKAKDLKIEIDLSRIYLSDKERVLYWKEILFSFEKLQENRSDIIKRFPVINKLFIEIDNYFVEKYDFQTESDFALGKFSLKSQYNEDDLRKIFGFLTRNDYVNGELYSKNDFISVIHDETTESIIQFKCFTYTAVAILNKLQELFLNMNPTSIEESGRFITKSGKIINASNYYRVNHDLDSKDTKDLKLINHFFQKNYQI